jgi:spectinomycin phosphotransferase
MLKKPFLSTQRIISCLHADYGIKVATLILLPLGADMNASVYKVQADDKSCYFIKVKSNYNQDISAIITRLLWENGIQHVILPIKTIHGQQSQRIDSFTLIAYPFIEGEDGFSRELTNDQWIMLGKALKQIHEISIPPSIQSQIRQETYSALWREAVKSIFTSHEVNRSQDEIALKLLEFMKENKEVILRLVNRAEELSQKLKNHPAEYVLCHSDIHGGNVLIDENSCIYIVDWDDPIMAPKERDLMLIGGGVGNIWNKPHGEELFYKGYGITQINRTIVAYYRHERVIEDIAEYYQELLLAPINDATKQMMYKQFIGMFAPQGVVDIAFRTDINL